MTMTNEVHIAVVEAELKEAGIGLKKAESMDKKQVERESVTEIQSLFIVCINMFCLIF